MSKRVSESQLESVTLKTPKGDATSSKIDSDGKDFFQALIGSLSREEFFSDVWQQKPFYAKRVVEKLTEVLPTLQTDISSLSSVHEEIGLWVPLDISVARYSSEYAVIGESQRIPVSWEKVQSYLEGGWCVTYLQAHSILPSLAKLLKLFESVWTGVDECSIQLCMIPKGAVPFSPITDDDDVFFIQLKGTQNVQIFQLPEGQGLMSDVVSTDELDQCRVADLPLETGGCLYIPNGLSVFTQAESESLHIRISFPSQPSWTEVANLAIENAKKKLNIPEESIVLPPLERSMSIHQEAACEMATKILNEARLLTQTYTNYFQFRSKYTKLDFNLNSWIDKYNLKQKITEGNGFGMIPNFLPEDVALIILESLEMTLDSDWYATEGQEDYQLNNIEHKFFSSKQFPYSESIFHIFKKLIPEQEMTISAAKYTKGHFINPHEDIYRQEFDGQLYDRDIAIVYYLNREWIEEDGGVFIDMYQDQEERILPIFNTLIAFQVPRKHQVTKVLTDKTRYSLFGWYLTEVLDDDI